MGRRLLPVVALVVVGLVLLTGCDPGAPTFLRRTLSSSGSGVPVGQRCGSLSYEINPHGAPSSWWLIAVHAAVQETEAATGTSWRFAGYTNDRVETGFGFGAHGGTVLFQFGRGRLEGFPRGAYAVANPATVNPGDRYSGGFVAVDPAELDDPLNETARTLMVVMLHEVGHVLGLGHAAVANDRSVMGAVFPSTRLAGFTALDLDALDAVSGSCKRPSERRAERAAGATPRPWRSDRAVTRGSVPEPAR